MPFLRTAPKEILIPLAEVLPDSRKRLTRTFQLAEIATMPAQLGLAWGVEDPYPQGQVPSGWTGLRLIKLEARDEARPFTVAKGEDSRPVVEMVFEQIDQSAETQVGKVNTTKLEDGRTAKVFEYVQFTTGTYTPGTVGTSTAPGDSSAFLLKEEAPDDGTLRHITRTYVYAGLIKSSIRSREDGLREQTYVSMLTKQTPTGIVIVDDTDDVNGYPRFTVTAVQSPTGGDPTGSTFTFQRYHPFTYPGRLKTYVATNGAGQRFLDVFKSPPQQVDVLATVTITYQTADSIGSLPATLWQPLEGATIIGQWVTIDQRAINVVESWRDYRSVSNTPISITGNIITPNDSVFGQLLYGGYDGTAQATGGPADPGGGTFTIATPTLDLAFQSVTGTKYFRQTTIHAAIPAQPSLPV
jgi:hypothetical protein